MWYEIRLAALICSSADNSLTFFSLPLCFAQSFKKKSVHQWHFRLPALLFIIPLSTFQLQIKCIAAVSLKIKQRLSSLRITKQVLSWVSFIVSFVLEQIVSLQVTNMWRQWWANNPKSQYSAFFPVAATFVESRCQPGSLSERSKMSPGL